MTALLSIKVDLVPPTFYQKREQTGTAGPMKKRDGIPEDHSFARTYSVIKEQTVYTTAKRFRSSCQNVLFPKGFGMKNKSKPFICSVYYHS
jgi:hypothetical protein